MILKEATQKANFKQNIAFTSSAREAWSFILQQLAVDDIVLLPSYIGITQREGSGIFDPIIENNTLHQFYYLNSNLQIDVQKLEQQLKSKNFKLILLVHYFGFEIENIKEIVALCKDYGLLVVEDCAHIFTYNFSHYSKTGHYADYTLYSLHKTFPFEDGGMLLDNSKQLQLSSKHKLKLSVQLYDYDLQSIAEKRRQNFLLYDELLDIEGIRKFKTHLHKHDIPHNYPVVIENRLREKLYFWLHDQNIPVIALYYRLIDSLQGEDYKHMQQLSDSILNLPTHQDTNEKEIRFLIENIQQFYDER